MEIEVLDENIGRWETTYLKFCILHLTVLIWWGTTSITDIPKENLNSTIASQRADIEITVSNHYVKRVLIRNHHPMRVKLNFWEKKTV